MHTHTTALEGQTLALPAHMPTTLFNSVARTYAIKLVPWHCKVRASMWGCDSPCPAAFFRILDPLPSPSLLRIPCFLLRSYMENLQ